MGFSSVSRMERACFMMAEVACLYRSSSTSLFILHPSSRRALVPRCSSSRSEAGSLTDDSLSLSAGCTLTPLALRPYLILLLLVYDVVCGAESAFAAAQTPHHFTFALTSGGGTRAKAGEQWSVSPKILPFSAVLGFFPARDLSRAPLPARGDQFQRILAHHQSS